MPACHGAAVAASCPRHCLLTTPGRRDTVTGRLRHFVALTRPSPRLLISERCPCPAWAVGVLPGLFAIFPDWPSDFQGQDPDGRRAVDGLSCPV